MIFRLLMIFTSLVVLPGDSICAAVTHDLPPAVSRFLQQHCAACHSGQQIEADFTIDTLTFKLDNAEMRHRWIHLTDRVAQHQIPPAATTQRFTGLNLFPELSTFGEREAMFFACNNRLVPIDGSLFSRMTPVQRRDPTLELALFRSATWPCYGYPLGFLAKETGSYRVRFAGRAVRQVRDFRLAVAHQSSSPSFRARQPSGPDVSGDVRVDHYNQKRLHSTIGYVTPPDMLEGPQLHSLQTPSVPRPFFKISNIPKL